MRRFTAVAALALGAPACTDRRSPVAARATLTPTPARFAKGGGVPIPGEYIVQFRDDGEEVQGKAIRLAAKHAGTLKHVYDSALRIDEVTTNGRGADCNGHGSHVADTVAGVSALYLQANPSATPAPVDAAVKANASTTSVPSGTTNKFLYSA